jgi:NAD(P)-dependent dehydrogenase (short-subunit alcohol dehydrogenase family)
MPNFDVPGKVAVITGGARGIGYVVAGTLACHGADIVLVDRLHDELEAACPRPADRKTAEPWPGM